MNAVPYREAKYRFVADLVMKRADISSILLVYSRYVSIFLILFIQIAMVLSAMEYTTSSPNVAANLVTVLLLVPLFFFQVTKLQLFYLGIMNIAPHLYAYYDLLTYRNKVACGPRALDLNHAPEIGVRGLSFGYDSKSSILNGLSVSFLAGKTVALVARSGGGKSTLLKLICRLYDATEGDVLIDGENIRNFSCASVRNNILCLSQFPLFTKGSIRENFHLLCPNASDAEMEWSCKETGVQGLLQLEGVRILDYQLTLGGENLSGGQRKLLALARVMLCDPKVLLLDEPTTGVDSETIKNYIAPAVQKLKLNRTTVVVDHNMNFIRNLSDYVAVIDSGRIVDYGPIELIIDKDNSLFHCLWAEYNKKFSAAREQGWEG
jgi:ABC-type multidrug transport system fused ATPase/permease subunit